MRPLSQKSWPPLVFENPWSQFNQHFTSSLFSNFILSSTCDYKNIQTSFSHTIVLCNIIENEFHKHFKYSFSCQLHSSKMCQTSNVCILLLLKCWWNWHQVSVSSMGSIHVYLRWSFWYCTASNLLCQTLITGTFVPYAKRLAKLTPGINILGLYFLA